jgi:hypothetical protein
VEAARVDPILAAIKGGLVDESLLAGEALVGGEQQHRSRLSQSERETQTRATSGIE